MSVKDSKRKSSLPKGLKTQAHITPNNNNNQNNSNNSNSKLQNSVNNQICFTIVNSSKLQSPTSININSQNQNFPMTIVDSKTVK